MIKTVLAISITAGLLTAASSRAEVPLPLYDVERYCDGLPRTAPRGVLIPFNLCLEAPQRSYDAVKAFWSELTDDEQRELIRAAEHQVPDAARAGGRYGVMWVYMQQLLREHSLARHDHFRR